MKNDGNVKPEVIAVISAAVQMMGGGKVRAVRIKPSKVWAMAARK
jgi:hypothetical protein